MKRVVWKFSRPTAAVIDLTTERAARFRVAVTALQTAIDLEAPRATIDKLQADVCRYRCKGLGDNIVSMERF